MRNFAHVIAEFHYGSWSAWFSDKPQLACGGNDWACAVASLIDIYGSPQLQWELIVAIEETTSERHAEFLIPYAKHCRYPAVMSVN